MFDFEKLEVYNQAHETNRQLLRRLFADKNMDRYLADQLKRSCISIALNIAEGVGRMTPPDKRHYFVMARGSVNETVALMMILKDMNWLPKEDYQRFYKDYETVSKMLLGMIRSTR